MARGWHYTKLYIECPSPVLFWHVYFVTVPFFLSFLFCFVVIFLLSLELCKYSSIFFLSSRPRTGLAITCQSTPRPSEHPPVMGEKMSKRLGGIKGCKYKTSSWHLKRFLDADNIGSTV